MTDVKRGTCADWVGVGVAVVVFGLGVIAACCWTPRGLKPDEYLGVVAAVVAAAAIPIGISEVAERFTASRFWPTFQKSMIVVGAIWALVAAVATAHF